MTEYINFLSKHIKSVEDYEISCWRKSHCEPKNIKIQELDTIKRFIPVHTSLQKLTPNDLSYETSIENHQEYNEKLYKVTYCKPWKKLSQYHQREKIKEYMCSLKYGKKISVHKKDFFSMKYFQYGQAFFPYGAGDGESVYFTPFSTVDHLTSYRI